MASPRACLPAGDIDASWLALGTLDGEPCFVRVVETALPARALLDDFVIRHGGTPPQA